LSEALEGFRKSKQDDHLPHRAAVEVELADAVIRIMDLSGALGLDVTGAIIEKLNYNQHRDDHKIDVRAGVGGKKF
jgi:NTP pyrophosphatase (non-canonical NTP hydrolase)